MVYIFSMITLVFFAVIGISAFITSVKDRAYRTEINAALVLKGLNAENAEARTRAALCVCRRYRGIELTAECEDDEARKIFLAVVSGQNVDSC